MRCLTTAPEPEIEITPGIAMDEFAVLLIETASDEGREAAEKLQRPCEPG